MRILGVLFVSVLISPGEALAQRFSTAHWQRRITLINQTVNRQDSSGTSLALPARAHSAGNLIVIWVKYEGTGSTTVSASDTIGNTYSAKPSVSHSNKDLHGRGRDRGIRGVLPADRVQPRCRLDGAMGRAGG